MLGCDPGLSEAELKGYGRALISTLKLPDPLAVGKAFLELQEPMIEWPQLLGTLAEPSPEALARALELSYRRDFEAGEVLQVAGWWLSRTECVLCAWLSLDSAEQPVARVSSHRRPSAEPAAHP